MSSCQIKYQGNIGTMNMGDANKDGAAGARLPAWKLLSIL